jgi:hypothetical protein
MQLLLGLNSIRRRDSFAATKTVILNRLHGGSARSVRAPKGGLSQIVKTQLLPGCGLVRGYLSSRPMLQSPRPLKDRFDNQGPTQGGMNDGIEVQGLSAGLMI